VSAARSAREALRDEIGAAKDDPNPVDVDVTDPVRAQLLVDAIDALEAQGKRSDALDAVRATCRQVLERC
jgi:hypothetical protein